MVLLEPRGHFIQSDQPGRGQNTRLAHSSTKRLAKTTRPLDVLAAADQHGADRSTQAFGETEHDRGKASGQPVYRDGQRGGGIEDARAIKMHGQARIGGAGPDFFRNFQRHDRSAGHVVRILKRDQAGLRPIVEPGRKGLAMSGQVRMPRSA